MSSDTLLERIKRIDEQDHALGIVACYAGDVLETINDAVAAERARLIEQAEEFLGTHRISLAHSNKGENKIVAGEGAGMKLLAAALKTYLESLRH